MQRVIATLVATGMVCLLSTAGVSPRNGAESRVTMDFKDAPLGDVLHMLSTQCGVNIVLGNAPVATVTASLVDLPFEDALRTILGTQGLRYHWDGQTVVVDSKLAVTRVITLQYVDARKVAESLKALISPAGLIQAIDDPFPTGIAGGSSASRLVVIESEDRVSEIEQVARSLDTPPVQVSIEAKFVETSLGNDEQLGIRWNLSGSLTGATSPTSFPFPKDVTNGKFTPTPNPGVDNSQVVKEFPPGELFPYANAGDFVYGKLSAAEFSVVMQAIEARRNANLVSAPHITTLNNVPAEILIGEQVPIALYERQRETGIMEVTGYEQQNIGVSLLVTPHAGDSGILLDVAPTVSRILEYRGQFNERPVTSTRTARTQVLAGDGETIVIGGMISEISRETVTGVPGLRSIPLLGALFRHKSIQKEKVDLMIFITAKIVRR